jgi:hypothetical protein
MTTFEHTPASGTEIHPELRNGFLPDLLRPERPQWTARELRDLTSTVAAELTTPLLSVLRYDEKQRWWTRLGLTDGVELWLLSWLPGQFTAPHDHGGASGSFTVLLGAMSEEYRYPSGPIRGASYAVGQAIGFGAGRAHQLGNAGTAPAATVHAYSPPSVDTREYATLADVPAEIPSLIPEPR